MIQFNLLPNVKLEYVKTQHTKHMLTTVSFFVSVASIGVLLLAFVSVDVVQKKSLSDLNKDIGKYSTQLKNVKDLDKILTVQNQLSTLTGLHDKKPVVSRLFDYMSKMTPAQATLNLLTVDFASNTMTVGGTAFSLDSVSNFTDTLKKTTYTTDSSKTAVHPFTDVVLSSFGRSSSGATFTITTTFNPTIFDSASTVTLNVPQTANADSNGVFQGGN